MPPPHQPGPSRHFVPISGPITAKNGAGGHRSIRPQWQVTLEKVLLLLRVCVPMGTVRGSGRALCQQPRGPPSTWVWVSIQCLSRVGGRWGYVGPARWWQWPERPHSCLLSVPGGGGRGGPPSPLPIEVPRSPRVDLLGRDSH